MKRLILIATLLTLPLRAQEPTAPSQEAAPTTEAPASTSDTPSPDTPDETGTGVATVATQARSVNWRNWAFAGAALVLAAAGITIVTLDQGQKSP